MKQLVFLLLVLPLHGFGMDRISALSMLETGNNDRAVGKAGEISRFQVRKSEWEHVTKSANYTDSETARTVVVRIMEKRIHEFKARFGRLPNDFEFYGLWNAPSQVMNNRLNRVVMERCERFANLCERQEQLAEASSPGRKAPAGVF